MAKPNATTRPKQNPRMDPFDLFDKVQGDEVQRASGFWTPETPGEILVGYYAAKREPSGEVKRPIADIKQFDGTIIPVGLNPILEQLLTGDLVGEYVVIQYVREIRTKRMDTNPEASPLREFRVKTVDEDEAREVQASLDNL